MYAFNKFGIFTSICISFTYGLVPDKGCPNVEPVDNFNLTGIYGTWHEIARYSNEFEKTNCGELEYKVEGDKVKIQIVDTVNVPHHSTDFFETLFEADPQGGDKGIIMHDVFFGNPRVMIQVREYLLAIDYDKYYIGYECNYNEETKAIVESAWIMTRSKDYAGEVKDIIENFMNTSKVIDRSKLIYLDTLEKTC